MVTIIIIIPKYKLCSNHQCKIVTSVFIFFVDCHKLDENMKDRIMLKLDLITPVANDTNCTTLLELNDILPQHFNDCSYIYHEKGTGDICISKKILDEYLSDEISNSSKNQCLEDLVPVFQCLGMRLNITELITSSYTNQDNDTVDVIVEDFPNRTEL